MTDPPAGNGAANQKYGSISPALRDEGLEMLKETSRTFYIPISRLPVGLLEAVASAYLCLRAIDEIEDHPSLAPDDKIAYLHHISQSLQAGVDGLQWQDGWNSSDGDTSALPVVSLRWADWVRLAPPSVAGRIWDATASMADRMASWVERQWQVKDETDLNRYTFGVAGSVGLLLSDLWAWYDGTQTNRLDAIGFGRGLQAVNILRNREDDLGRGTNFFPAGWDAAQMEAYARRNLALADAYLDSLAVGPVRDFCIFPLTLAYATLDAMAQGRKKLERSEVLQLLAGLAGQTGESA